jgi:hypothetical protein
MGLLCDLFLILGWQEGVKNPHVKPFLERLAQADPRPDSLLHLLDTVVSGCVCG